MERKMKKTLKTLNTLDFSQKKVFLRADLNVPIVNKQIVQDYRLQEVKPTIDYILKHGGKIILATHLGRPDPVGPSGLFDENLSTKILLPWFKNNNYTIAYESDLLCVKNKNFSHLPNILLLENLRFFKGEKEPILPFAQLLASLADIYINDAFGLIHRNDTSITLVPEQFPQSQRAAGFLIEKEVTQLLKLKEQPSQHMIALIGGSKLTDKIAMLEQFMAPTQTRKLKAILLGGFLSRAFLKIQNLSCGQDEFNQKTLDEAHKILKLAQNYTIEIRLPLDYCYTLDTLKSPSASVLDTSKILTCPAQNIPPEATCGDIGPETIKSFVQEIQKADVIFCNGPMGIYEQQVFSEGTKALLAAMAANQSAYTVIGGGDTVAAAIQHGYDKNISFLSTGGGATLAFLGAKNIFKDLPALGVLTG
jgi:phosphoglycerate kinase